MLREIEKAVEALKAVPAEYHDLVVAEAQGKGKKKGPKVYTMRAKPGPKPGPKPATERKKPGPKPGFKKAKKVEPDNVPVKVDPAKLEKLKKLKGLG